METKENKETTWTFRQKGFTPADEPLYGALLTQGNGYLGVRGSFEELGPASVQGLFVTGVYAKAVTHEFYHGDNFFKKRIVFDEDKMKSTLERNEEILVNLPDFLYVRFFIQNRPVFMWDDEVEDFERELNFANGLLTRRFTYKHANGSLYFSFSRFPSQNDPHVFLNECTVRSQDFHGTIELASGIDGRSYSLTQNLTELVEAGSDGSMLFYRAAVRCPVPLPGEETPVTLEVRQTVCNHLFINGKPVEVKLAFGKRDQEVIYGQSAFDLIPGDTVTLYKVSTIFTSRDAHRETIDIPAEETRLQRKYAELGYKKALSQTCSVWDSLWASADIQLDGDDDLQQGIRFTQYHLLIARPYLDWVSIPAKTLSGIGYKGLFWWDTEIYIAPFFYSHFPELGRKLLQYRYHTLGGAKENSLRLGLTGAKYAWTTTLTGVETCFSWLPIAAAQIHIASDIPYSFDHYTRITGDRKFLIKEGLEIMIETARYYRNRVVHNRQQDRYEIRNVGGPDEYHSNVSNNAYTNYLLRWHLRKMLELLDVLETEQPADYAALNTKLALTGEELRDFRDISEKITIPYDEASGILEQFEGYLGLADSWEQVGEKYGGPAANYHLTKGLKQPDTLLLLTLFPDDFTQPSRLANWDLYEPFTQHGSSLSPGIHALLAAQCGLVKKAVEYLRMCTTWDISNKYGDSHLGIHAALCGSVYLATVYGFGGIRNDGQTLRVQPILPEQWQALRFHYRFLGVEISLKITQQTVSIYHTGNVDQSIQIQLLNQETRVMMPGEQISILYRRM
jgi:kojibiose phosphorylase